MKKTDGHCSKCSKFADIAVFMVSIYLDARRGTIRTPVGICSSCLGEAAAVLEKTT